MDAVHPSLSAAMKGHPTDQADEGERQRFEQIPLSIPGEHLPHFLLRGRAPCWQRLVDSDGVGSRQPHFHGMIHIVVLKKSLTTSGVEVCKTTQVRQNGLAILAVSQGVDGVCLGLTDDKAPADIGLAKEFEGRQTVGNACQQRLCLGMPQGIPLITGDFGTDGGVSCRTQRRTIVFRLTEAIKQIMLLREYRASDRHSPDRTATAH